MTGGVPDSGWWGPWQSFLLLWWGGGHCQEGPPTLNKTYDSPSGRRKEGQHVSQ